MPACSRPRDIGYARDCLSGVKRGAGGIDDVVKVIRAKCAGRDIRTNGYIKQVIEDQFGETEVMRREREEFEVSRGLELARKAKERRDVLEPLELQGKHAASQGDRDALELVMAEIKAVKRRFAP